MLGHVSWRRKIIDLLYGQSFAGSEKSKNKFWRHFKGSMVPTTAAMEHVGTINDFNMFSCRFYLHLIRTFNGMRASLLVGRKVKFLLSLFRGRKRKMFRFNDTGSKKCAAGTCMGMCKNNQRHDVARKETKIWIRIEQDDHQFSFTLRFRPWVVAKWW